MFFETICDGASVFGMYFAWKDDEDALDVALAQMRARELDMACDVVCTSCNFVRDRSGEQSDIPRPFQSLDGQMNLGNSLQDSSDSDAERIYPHSCD